MVQFPGNPPDTMPFPPKLNPYYYAKNKFRIIIAILNITTEIERIGDYVLVIAILKIVGSRVYWLLYSSGVLYFGDLFPQKPTFL